MAAGPKKKYKIQIIKAGIGDPLISIAFQFVGDDSNYDNPEEYPVENLDMAIHLQYENNAHNQTVDRVAGDIQMANFGTLNTYYLTFPFDQPEDFSLGNSMWVKIHASGTDDEGVSYSIAFSNAPGTSKSTRQSLSYDAAPIEFATLNTRYTYCPGGDCATLGLEQ